MGDTKYRFVVGVRGGRRSLDHVVRVNQSKGDIYVVLRGTPSWKFSSHRGGQCHLKEGHLESGEWSLPREVFLRKIGAEIQQTYGLLMPIFRLFIWNPTLSLMEPPSEAKGKRVHFVPPYTDKPITVVSVIRDRFDTGKLQRELPSLVPDTRVHWVADLGYGESCAVISQAGIGGFDGLISPSAPGSSIGDVYFPPDNPATERLDVRMVKFKSRPMPNDLTDGLMEAWEFGGRASTPKEFAELKRCHEESKAA